MRFLSYLSGGLMIGVALIIDFILDPVVDFFTFGFGGFLVDIIAIIIFWPWMKMQGISLFGENATGTLITAIVEAIPILNLLAPGWTLRVAILVTREWRH